VLIEQISDIDGILLFGKFHGYSLSELYRTWDGRNYMLFIIKNFKQPEIVDFVSNYWAIMITPLSFFEYFGNPNLYKWNYDGEN
jgi:hypothetical protein